MTFSKTASFATACEANEINCLRVSQLQLNLKPECTSSSWASHSYSEGVRMRHSRRPPKIANLRLENWGDPSVNGLGTREPAQPHLLPDRSSVTAKDRAILADPAVLISDCRDVENSGFTCA